MKLQNSFSFTLPKLLWIIPVVFFGYTTLRYFALNGTYTYTWVPSAEVEHDLLPQGRSLKPSQDLKSGEVSQRVVGDPVYLTVQVPRTFESVNTTVQFANQGQPIVEMGLQNSQDWTFDLKPLDVPLIENLNWYKVKDDVGNVLYQKENRFASIADFLKMPPIEQHIGLYHQTVSVPYSMPNYQPGPALNIDTPFRGAQQFKIYVENQVVSVNLDWVDLNRAFNSDGVTLSLIQNGQVVAQANAVDDGNEVADGKNSSKQTLSVTSSQPLSGLIDVVLSTTDDALFTHLATSASYLVTSAIFLAGNKEYQNSAVNIPTQPTQLTTNATSLQAIIYHPQAAQILSVETLELSIRKINVPTLLTLPNDLTQTIQIPLNDVALTTQGWMAFTPQSFFDPDYFVERLTPNTDPDRLDYIFSSPLPEHLVTDNTRTVNFDMSQVPGDKKTLNFIISAPGLDLRKAELVFKSIRFEFHRPPVTLSSFWQRLRQHF